MVFHCAGKFINGSKLSMTGRNANTKCIYECLPKVRSAPMDLIEPGCTFNCILRSRVHLDLETNTQLFPTEDAWRQSSACTEG